MAPTIKRQFSLDLDTNKALDAYCQADPLIGERGRSRVVNQAVKEWLLRKAAEQAVE
jgi:hypothetical protein